MDKSLFYVDQLTYIELWCLNDLFLGIQKVIR